MPINEDTLNEMLGRFVGDFGAAAHGASVVVGDKLGLYKTMAASGPLTAHDLAEVAGYDERLIQEWLNAQFVSGYCDHDPSAQTFWLT